MENLNINSEITKEITKEITDIWKNLRKKWYYPQIPEPVILCDREGSEDAKNARVFIENYKIGFNIGDLPDDSTSRKIFMENFFEHEICHYVFCPRTIDVVGGLILSARRGLQKYYNSDEVDVKEVNLAVNFFTDLVTENFRYEKSESRNKKGKNIILYHELRCQKIQNEDQSAIPSAIPKIYLILIYVLGNLWNYQFKFSFSEEIKIAGDLIGEMQNFSNRNLWNVYCYNITFYIAKFLEEEANKKKKEEKDKKEEGKKGIIPLFLKGISSKIIKKIGGEKKKKERDKKGGKDMDEKENEKVKKNKINENEKKEQTERSEIDTPFYHTLEEVQKIQKKDDVSLQKIAEKNDIKEYKEVLKVLGITDDESEAIKRWYRDQAYGIEIQHKEKFDKTEYAISPTKWRMEDPISELDFTYSLSLSSYLIPGLTTFKRQFEEGRIMPTEIKVPDLLIVIDSSYSMGEHIRGTKTFFATLAAFKAYRYAIGKGAKVAVINFSGRNNSPLFIQQDFTDDTEKIENHLIYHYGLYTCIPGKTIEEISKRKNVLILILTDAQIQNFWAEIEYLKSAAKENFLNVMCTAYNESQAKENPAVEELQKIGKIYFVSKASDLIGLIIKTASRVYE